MAGGTLVNGTPEETFEQQTVTLVHHLCPQTRPFFR
jgi:hypothetical protein